MRNSRNRDPQPAVTELRRMMGVAAGLAETFAAFQKDAPGRNLPALEPLVKAAEDTRARLNVILFNNSGQSAKDWARLETAGYPLLATGPGSGINK